MDDRASSVTGAKAAEQYLAHHHAANDDDDDDLDAALVAAMLEADVRESAVPVTTGLQVMASPAELDRVEALFARLEAGDALAGGGAALPEERMRRIIHGGCLQKVGTEATFKREHAREVFVVLAQGRRPGAHGRGAALRAALPASESGEREHQERAAGVGASSMNAGLHFANSQNLSFSDHCIFATEPKASGKNDGQQHDANPPRLNSS